MYMKEGWLVPLIFWCWLNQCLLVNIIAKHNLISVYILCEKNIGDVSSYLWQPLQVMQPDVSMCDIIPYWLVE